MFRNIKQLSEYSPRGEGLVFAWAKPQPEIVNPWEQGQAAKEVTSAERLDALKKSVAADFGKHLEDYKTEIMLFMAGEEVQKYETGEWKKWNVDLLKAMGFANVSLEDSKGIIKRLQEYLRTKDPSVKADGEFGPNLLKTLESYYKNDERYGWVPGVTKAAFSDESNNESYYLTVDGRWIDKNHKPVKLEGLLPLLAKSGTPNSRGYFEINDIQGVKYYVDRQGNTYKTRMPADLDGPADWKDDNPYLAPDKQGEVPPLPTVPPAQPKPPVEPEPPKPVAPVAPDLVAASTREGQVGWVEGVTKYYFFLKNETAKTASAGETDLQGEVFYVLNNGQWVDYLHNPIDLEAVLPKLAKPAEPLNGYYKVADGGGAEHYIDREGKVYYGMPPMPGPERWAKAGDTPAERKSTV